MSNSPIFDQLASEFAAKGVVYEEFIKWSTPAFVWDPRPVVQLDKQRNMKLVDWFEDHKVESDSTMDFGRLIQDYVPQRTAQSITSVMPLSARNTAQPME
jgi:hypothetical protein